MKGLETNIFNIENIAEFSARYRLYKILNLDRNQDEYFQNKAQIVRQISFQLRTSAIIIEIEGIPHLVLSERGPEPPSPYDLVRTVVIFEKVGVLPIDFTERSVNNDDICLRFLNFALQSEVWKNRALWQLGSGTPFYERNPTRRIGDIDFFQGFAFRAIVTPNGGIGLCVDFRGKFVSNTSLPLHLSRDKFRKYAGSRFVYHFGRSWYDVKLDELHDLDISTYPIVKDGKNYNLREYILKHAPQPLPKEVTNLLHDSSVAIYRTNKGEPRAVPTGLCYAILDNRHSAVRHNHKLVVPHPKVRRSKIHKFTAKYLSSLKFGDVPVRLSSTQITIPQAMFQIPDYEFGEGHIVSVSGTPQAQQVSLDNIGRVRLDLLADQSVGFYDKAPLGQQYLVLPESVEKSWGEKYTTDIQNCVADCLGKSDNQVLPPYAPKIITYPDGGPRTFVAQGKSILTAIEEEGQLSGHMLVMLHHTRDQKFREHDQLGAMIINRLERDYDLRVAVNHSAVGQECYDLISKNGIDVYEPNPKKAGKLRGYIRGVVLNKILLTNENWPFVLATPLEADLTIGIDAKHSTAGFTLVGNMGARIRTEVSRSRHREKLGKPQVKTFLFKLISKEAEVADKPIERIVIHRDGRLFQSEIDGIQEALILLKEKGTLPKSSTVTFLEISKTSPVPIRFFDVTKKWDDFEVKNPQVGCYHIIDDRDAYLCTTGKAFFHPGTTRPLHIRYVDGDMPFEDCLRDVYYLTALTWTRPEDCTRDPITIKLTDRRLGEDASEYDEEAIDFSLDI